MSRTDNFDVAVQLMEGAIQKVVSSQHAAGIIINLLPWVAGGKKGDLLLNSPTVTLTPTAAAAKRTLLNARVFYNARPAGSGYEVAGECAVLDVACKADFSLTSGNPGLLTSSSRLSMDWTPTVRGDVTAHAATTALATEATDVLMSAIQSNPVQQFPLPAIGSGAQRVGCLGFHFATSGGTRFVTIGMNIGNVVKGSLSNLTTKFVQNDWALAISGAYFLARIQANLNSQLPLPHQLSSRCTVQAPGPLSGCWNRSTVTLTSLHVTLTSSGIRVSGNIHVSNSGALIPDIDASFTAKVSLTLTSSGSLTASVHSIEVSLSVLGDLINFLTGNSFTNKISSAVQAAVSGGMPGGLSSFFSAAQLNELARAGGPHSPDVELEPRSVQVDSGGIVIHGDIIAPKAAAKPEPAFFAIPSGTVGTRFVLNARQSIAPGNEIVSYFWEHSDGTSEEYAGTSAKFVTDHDYDLSVLSFPAMLGTTPLASSCLTITNKRGESEKLCVAVLESRRTEAEVCLEQVAVPLKGTIPIAPEPPVWHTHVVPTGGVVDDIFAMPLMTGRRTWEIDGNILAGPSIGFTPIVPEPPDLDIVFEHLLPPLVIPFCITWARRHLVGASVIIAGDRNWTAKGETNKLGVFVLEANENAGLFRALRGSESKSQLARERIVVRAARKDLETTETVFWISLKPDRQQLAARLKMQVEEAHAVFTQRLEKAGLAEMADLLKLEPNIRRKIVSIARSLNLLREAHNLILHGSAMKQLARLFGVPNGPNTAIDCEVKIAEYLKATQEGLESKWSR